MTQNENYLVDENAIDNWKQVGKIEKLHEVRKLCENNLKILHSQKAAAHIDQISRLPESNRKSLTFVEVDVNFKKEQNHKGHDKWYGHFSDNNKNQLRLPITDPKAFDKLNEQNKLRKSKCFLTISLAANPYGEFYHKLIAGVIWPEMLTL